MSEKIMRIAAVLLVLPLLGGTQCSFVATSGGHSKDDEKQNGLVVVIRDGRLVDAPVQGVRYDAGALGGLTGPDGEFQYEEGGRVRFSIGDITLGDAVPGKALITPLDLVPNGTLDTPAVINIARLLQSLDAVAGDGRITIPPLVHSRARRSNAEVSAAIDFIDFSDDAGFANAASQLVATLGGNSRRSGLLVDVETARRHLRTALAELGREPPALRVPGRQR